ncbi:MAG: tetratricopeptide repeat protein, partial [Ekhidna sp.]|nr:tetratricopeptide repeat protein [Ekhidna sp.]
ITYYVQHEQHELLLGLIDRWIEEYDLKEEYMLLYIKSLVSSSNRKQASLELRQYLVQNQSAEDLLFAADQYLQIGDTAMAVFCLGKIHGEFPRDPLMWPYGFALVRLGYPELGLQVLKEYLEEENGNADLILSYAVLLDQSGRNSEARDVIKPLVTVRDTATFLLADWYLKNRKWDSAGYVLNDLIQKDSSNRKPIWKAGRLYEDQGWFSTSMRYYEYLVELDSLDTLASQRIDLIQRKIAYLQRLKFEESKITTIELQPKKIKINE